MLNNNNTIKPTFMHATCSCVSPFTFRLFMSLAAVFRDALDFLAIVTAEDF